MHNRTLIQNAPGAARLEFYAPPRLVTHIDEGAVAALTQAYRQLLSVGGRLLDLMSNWVSHLPDDREYAQVVGYGMNGVELEANPRLMRWFVQNLNQDPLLPLGDQAFDAAMACVGVQYLQQPVAVFAEVRRVLAPGAPFHRQLFQSLLPDQGSGDLAGAGHERASRFGKAVSGARRVYEYQRQLAGGWRSGRSPCGCHRPDTAILILRHPIFWKTDAKTQSGRCNLKRNRRNGAERCSEFCQYRGPAWAERGRGARSDAPDPEAGQLPGVAPACAHFFGSPRNLQVTYERDDRAGWQISPCGALFVRSWASRTNRSPSKPVRQHGALP